MTDALTARPPHHGIHPPITALPNALTFRLARLVAVNDAAGGAQFRAAFGLSLNEWRVIGLVQALGPVGFGRLRKSLLMDKGQLSRVLKALTSRALISARPVAGDARSVELLLTETGRALHDDALAFTTARNEVVVETLTQEECRQFMRLLEKITAHNAALANLSDVLE